MRPDRESALIGRQDLQFDHIAGVGQQLGDLHQRAVLRAGLIYGQEDVSNVQRSTPGNGEGRGEAGTWMLLLLMMSVGDGGGADLTVLPRWPP